MQNMIHGPCANWCIIDGKCSKHFPKSFNEETTLDQNSYPQYRRRDTGISYEKSEGFVIDNSWVVPYCPQLSMIFNCHLNVEVVSRVEAVKYINKYIYKGHDKASIIVGENVDTKINHDEIKDFIDARYVGPVEAAWRILGKPLQNKSHSIIRLPVHLPNDQSIIINDLDTQAIQSAQERTSMLIEYFAFNKRDENSRQYLYIDIPVHYVFKKITINGKQVQRWEKRKNYFNCIGRMYSVNPTQTELFHLRTLLLNVKGATSFNDLKTVNGEINSTYTSACLALGLIEDDHEWIKAMSEAMVWMMPQRLRHLFVRILIHCQPVNPKELWDAFKIPMSEDFIRRSEQTTGIKRAYMQIDKMLRNEGWDLSKFQEMDQIMDSFEQEEEQQVEAQISIGNQHYHQLNSKQKEIVDNVLNLTKRSNDDRSKCVYIDGPGGSGKTFTYTTLYHLLKSRGKVVSNMAFTGIAATLLPQGKTVHKTFGLPVPLFSDSTSNIKFQSKEAAYLRSVDVFIWDEAPMAPRYALEIIDKTLRDFMQSDLPFGNKIVILGGDFRQLLPVVPQGTRSETISLSIKFSSLWKYFQKFSLTENMRTTSQELEFANFLLNLGDGLLNDPCDNIEFPSVCVANLNANIVKETYEEIIKQKQYQIAAKTAILSPRNIDVDDINQQVVNLLDESTEKLYTSIDNAEKTGEKTDINETLLTEYLNTLNPTSLPPHKLRLRKYTVIMLIRNLSISEGLCNGTRLLVLHLGINVLKCEILSGDKSGEIVFLNRITLHCENTYPFTLKRRQFPIKIAFAMTINKSQGQTFGKIGIDLRRDVFNHGQLYVACSRVRSWNSLKVYLGHERQNNSIKNYVYKEIFK